MNPKVLGGLAAAALVGVTVYMVSTDRIGEQAATPSGAPASTAATGGMPPQPNQASTAIGDGGDAVKVDTALATAPPQAARDPATDLQQSANSSRKAFTGASATADGIAASTTGYCWDPFAWMGLANRVMSGLVSYVPQVTGTGDVRSPSPVQKDKG